MVQITVKGWVEDDGARTSGRLGAHWIKKVMREAVCRTKRGAKICGVKNPIRRKIVCTITVEDG